MMDDSVLKQFEITSNQILKLMELFEAHKRVIEIQTQLIGRLVDRITRIENIIYDMESEKSEKLN